FKLTDSVLIDAGFEPGTLLLLLRNPRFGTFAHVKVGHVITVKEGDHIFLKGLNILNCAMFDEQCETLSSRGAQPLHLRHNLPGERGYVRHSILTGKLQKLTKPPILLPPLHTTRTI